MGDSSTEVFTLFDDQLLEAVLMVQVGIQVLLHGFPGLFVLVDAFVVIFQLLEIDVGDELFQLF